MKDRRKPWQKAMINREFRFAVCGAMLQSTQRAHVSANKKTWRGASEIADYARALGLSIEAAQARIAAQHARSEAGFRVTLIAAE